MLFAKTTKNENHKMEDPTNLAPHCFLLISCTNDDEIHQQQNVE